MIIYVVTDIERTDRDIELAVIDHAGEHALVFPCRRTGIDIWIEKADI